MTTKWKIIAGFIVMILLLGSVAFIGYRGLAGAMEVFTEYRRLAHLNVNSSDLLANQHASSAAIRLFRISGDPSLAEEARTHIKDNQALAAKNKDFTKRQSTRDVMEDVAKRADEQVQTITAVEQGLLRTLDHYDKVQQPAARAFGAEAVKLSKLLSVDNNIAAAELSAVVLNELAAARAAFGRFAFARTQRSADLALESLGALTKFVDELGKLLKSDEERESFAKLRKALEDMATAANAMKGEVAELGKNNAKLVEINANLSKTIDRVSHEADGQMDTQEKRSLQINQSAQEMMIAVTIAGLFAGGLLAFFIIFGLIRVLNGMSRFAGAIAEGDFQARMTSREKGEIGAMLTAMRKIPAVLQAILAEYQALEERIEAGELDAKVDPAACHGGFTTLVTGTNAILGRFLQILENIPSPVLVMGKDLKLTYMNAIGREVFGADYKGKVESQISRSEDADTPADGLRMAVDTLRPASGDTRAHPQGKDMDISYAAIPMLNQEGKLASIMELITDLTAIKQTQRTIRNVADQAASISNRVAAASEELSAQVAQVSQGTEQQRARVESTVTAMTEMNSTVLEVARNAGQASEQSETTRNKAKDGATLVDKVVHSINLVNKVAASLQTNMRELGSQAESIGGVMNVISDIADQTNLLALNAAIEAARAGEAGRGFAVVADEVRKLAEKTMSATQEVGANITAIQQSARINITEVGEAAKAITEATDLANTSGQALTEIVNLASANSTVVSSIATAAEEQSATSEEINLSIEEINKIVGHTADGMRQASQAVHELAHMAQELHTVMAELQ